MKKMYLLLTVLVMLAGCATMPEGFEAQEQSTMDAKAKADEFNCAEIVPMEYEAANSVLKTAESQKQAKKYEESFELYKQAEQKFVTVRKQAGFKVEADATMNDADAAIKQIDEKSRELDSLEGGAQ
jgi:hypothetical protein